MANLDGASGKVNNGLSLSWYILSYASGSSTNKRTAMMKMPLFVNSTVIMFPVSVGARLDHFDVAVHASRLVPPPAMHRTFCARFR